MSALPQDERLDRREHVAPALSEARLDASWTTVKARRPKGRGAAIAGVSVAAAIAAAAVVAFVFWPASHDNAWAGTVLSTTTEPAEVTLNDGSTISAEPDTELELRSRSEDETRLALGRGAATFEVTRRPQRSFVIEAGTVEVRVIGTRFTVRRESSASGERVAVEVQRGIVEVEHAGRTRRLTAGEQWATEESLGELAESEPEAEGEEPAVEVMDEPQSNEVEAPRPTRANAAELFEQATAARRSGDPRTAERHYAALVSRYPSDGRAGLAAFELGRLRMDNLGNPRGAIDALRRALSIAPRSPFRQDAMARLVRAHERVGDATGCERAKQAYLSAYPSGRYATDIQQRCN